MYSPKHSALDVSLKGFRPDSPFSHTTKSRFARFTERHFFLTISCTNTKKKESQMVIRTQKGEDRLRETERENEREEEEEKCQLQNVNFKNEKNGEENREKQSERIARKKRRSNYERE